MGGGTITFMFLYTHTGTATGTALSSSVTAGQARQPHHLSCCPADTGTALSSLDIISYWWGGVGWGGAGWGGVGWGGYYLLCVAMYVVHINMHNLLVI